MIHNQDDEVVLSDGDRGASASARLTAPADDAKKPRLDFPVVGIGASAGGLEAYTEFLEAMPPDSGMAFILIQHLSPDRQSLVADILATHTKMRVTQVEDGQAVEPNCVYVIRPGFTLTIHDGKLHLGEALSTPGHRRPVDDLFRSLAEEQQQRAIAVILSGMGSNGTAGAQAIKAVGGLCIAQEPDTAKYPSMPRSLIESNLADFILKPAEIPACLARYTSHSYVKDPVAPAKRDEQMLGEILGVLRTRNRHDFSGYRKPTLVRRVRRRMGLNQIEDIGEYTRYLRQQTGEATALSDDLLIHVTGFFRDPEAWDALREKVVVPMMRERPDQGSVRAWVTACSTGEEAYSLAMLLIEVAEASGKSFDIKIFATDMAERSLATARAGIFPGGIESEVSVERLNRFFDRDDAMYRVKRSVRDLVVFAPQNVLQDPPFSRLDIATCRNLLIYLEPELQKRVLALLHFGLREGGTLMLGSSESVGSAEGHFETIDKKQRLFRRIGPTRHGSAELPLTLALHREMRENIRPATKAPVAQLVNRVLLDHHTPAAVVVDRNGHIVYYHRDTAPFLDQPRGEPTRDLLALATDQVRGAVRTAMQKAGIDGRPAIVTDGLIDTPLGRERVVVGAYPLGPRPSPAYMLITFASYPERTAPPADPQTPPDRRLIEDLARIRDELQSTVEEMQTSNEEMRASHEEVTSINEELQSTNEELETSKEELQSLNEELTTVNAQLQAKMEEIERSGNDLASLLSSTNIAVLFLDDRFRIRRSTPAVKDLLELIPSDEGRPLSDLRRKFEDPDLLGDAQAVLEKLVPIEREVASESGRVYLRRVLPYRTLDNRIDGVVLTFVDITERKRTVETLRDAERRFRLLADNVRDYAIFFTDLDGRIESWNEGSQRLLGYGADEVVGESPERFYTSEDRAVRLPEREFEQARATGRASDDNWLVRKDGTRFWASGSTTALRNAAGEFCGFVKIFRDLTEQRVAEAALLASEVKLKVALKAARMGIWTLNLTTHEHVRDGNLNALLGLPPLETRPPFDEFLTHIHPDDRQTVSGAFDNSAKHGKNLNVDFRVVWPDGTVRWLIDQGDIFADPDKAPIMTGACADITQRKQAEAEIRYARDELEQRVRERTSELVQEVSAREAAEASRQVLLARLNTAQEDERTRISRELHDSLGQYLAAMNLELRAAAGTPGVPGEFAARLEKLYNLTTEVGVEVDRIARELRPTAIDDLGAVAAIRNHLEDWFDRTGIPIEFDTRGLDGVKFSRVVSTTLFRVVQEALTNVLKHASATRVGIVLERKSDHVLAIVEDDGKGFDSEALPDPKRTGGGLGLLGMRERLALVDGTLEIESTPGGGTTLYARIPLDPQGEGHG